MSRHHSNSLHKKKSISRTNILNLNLEGSEKDELQLDDTYCFQRNELILLDIKNIFGDIERIYESGNPFEPNNNIQFVLPNKNENENENEKENENFKILVDNFEEKLLKVNDKFELINSKILNFEKLINTIKTSVDKLNNIYFKDELSFKKMFEIYKNKVKNKVLLNNFIEESQKNFLDIFNENEELIENTNVLLSELDRKFKILFTTLQKFVEEKNNSIPKEKENDKNNNNKKYTSIHITKEEITNEFQNLITKIRILNDPSTRNDVCLDNLTNSEYERICSQNDIKFNNIKNLTCNNCKFDLVSYNSINKQNNFVDFEKFEPSKLVLNKSFIIYDIFKKSNNLYKKLKKLYIENCKINDAKFKEITDIIFNNDVLVRNLKIISFNNNYITNVNIYNNLELKELHLKNNKISNFQFLRNSSPEINFIDLSDNNLSFPPNIFNMISNYNLFLFANNPFIYDEKYKESYINNLNKLIDVQIKIKYLNLSYIYNAEKYKNDLLNFFSQVLMGFETFKNLKYLNLSGNNLNNEDAIKIINYITNNNKNNNYKFENLILSDNNLTQIFLVQFLDIDDLYNLRLLNLSGNKKIIYNDGDFIILKLLKKFPKLNRIDLSNTEFEDKATKYFLNKFHNIELENNENKFDINFINNSSIGNEIEDLLKEIKINDYKCKIIINDKVNLKTRFKTFNILSNN